MNLDFLEQNFSNIENSLSYYYKDYDYLKYMEKVPKSRYHTFKYCLEEFDKNNFRTVVELGTTRSYVEGRFEGCMSFDTKYWEPNNPEKWDWSAGVFTKTFAECLKNIADLDFHTVDINQNHINISKYMTKEYSFMKYHTSSSEDFLNNFKGKIDFIYLDTGDLVPLEPTAELHFRETKIIVERDLISEYGLILIDDVRSLAPYQSGYNIMYGKGCLSIPYFLENGFKMVMDEYQCILQKM